MIQQLVHVHEVLQLTVGMLVPAQLAVHSPAPQWRVVPKQLLAWLEHWAWHGPSVQFT